MEELVIAHNRRRLGWVLVLTSTAYFMVALDATVVATALPRMQADLHVGLTSLQWTLNSYGIAFAAGIITAAALGDRYGRRLIGPERVGADRRPHSAGARRRDRAAAQPHDLDDRVPGRTARGDRGHL